MGDIAVSIEGEDGVGGGEDKVHETDLSMSHMQRIIPETTPTLVTTLSLSIFTSELCHEDVLSERRGHPVSHESPDSPIGLSVESAPAGRSR